MMQRKEMVSSNKNNWRKMLKRFCGDYYAFRQPLEVVIRFKFKVPQVYIRRYI